MTAPALFTPFNLGELKLENRIVIVPMGQYSAVDGSAGAWHMFHLGYLALAGAIVACILTKPGRLDEEAEDHVDDAGIGFLTSASLACRMARGAKTKPSRDHR